MFQVGQHGRRTFLNCVPARKGNALPITVGPTPCTLNIFFFLGPSTSNKANFHMLLSRVLKTRGSCSTINEGGTTLGGIWLGVPLLGCKNCLYKAHNQARVPNKADSEDARFIWYRKENLPTLYYIKATATARATPTNILQSAETYLHHKGLRDNGSAILHVNKLSKTYVKKSQAADMPFFLINSDFVEAIDRRCLSFFSRRHSPHQLE
uniref:Uncharacterized protein n=1 Tax=Rhizophora mucronata TaxID=61149 RepID=A0A2P2K4Z5_RHIMU